MTTLTPLQIVLAFALILVLLVLIICASAYALLVRMCTAPWRRIARRRAEQAAREASHRRLLNAIVQHKYRRGNV